MIYGINAWFVSKNLPKKYSYVLGEQMETVKTLENYTEKYRKVKLKALDNIVEPALGNENLLIINKGKLYEKDLFSNIYLLFQLELTKPDKTFVRNSYIYQNVLFIFQIIFFTLGIAINSIYSEFVIIFAILLELASIFFSIYCESLILFVLKKVLDIGKQILNLDDVEQARAEALARDLRLRAFEYPFEIVWRIFQFIKP